MSRSLRRWVLGLWISAIVATFCAAMFGDWINGGGR